jgi:predicted Zn-dependent protease with MMP-like domain
VGSTPDEPWLGTEDLEDRPLDAFEQAVEDALAAIPEPFASRLDSVAVVIEDEPSAEQLRRLRVPGLFGLYEGVSRTVYGADQMAWPSKITIFRGPLERFHGRGERLRAAVEDTVRHEIAHHFGISDERLRELQGR